MSPRCRFAFLALCAAQVLHSIEEYVTHLYDSLAPARFVSSLLSEDLALGFAIFNSGVVALLVLAYCVPVRQGLRAAWPIAGFVALVEIANGVAHLAFAAFARGYFSGALTAPLLIAGGVVLAKSLSAEPYRGRAASAL